MKTLEDFKAEKPHSWKNFGPSTKIMAALYFHSTMQDRLSKEQITQFLGEDLPQGELEKGLRFLQETEEVYRPKNSDGKKYSLRIGTRKAFRNLYGID